MPEPIRTGVSQAEVGSLHPFATEELWHRLARPFDIARTVEALLGIDADVIEQLADSVVAVGDEAVVLLEGMPLLARRLKMGTSQRVERSAAGLRGPVLWSETMAARSSSLGHAGVFVTSVPGRDYDVPENRVLLAALRVVSEASERVLRRSAGINGTDDEVVAAARHHADHAGRWIGHRALAQVGDGRRSRASDLRKVASGRDRIAYGPALDVLKRAAEPLSSDQLLPYCDGPTRHGHALVMAAIDALEATGTSVPALRVEDGAVVIGPYIYIHPRGRSEGRAMVGLLKGQAVVLALDPDQSGSVVIDPSIIGNRRLVVVDNPIGVADEVSRDRI